MTMQFEAILEFRKMEPKKKYRYTYLRFEKGQHTDLINKRAAVYELDGSFLIVPLDESAYTPELESKMLRAAHQQIRRAY